MGDLAIRPTAIPGLLVVDLVVHGDTRGWFKENWQRAKLIELGLPDFGPVQNNMSSNTASGVTRGLHAEPWDKLVSIAAGGVFAAWVDLREGDSFGTVVTMELGPETAVFVPRGVANGYQTLVENTVYSYLVNQHWSPGARDSYSYLNLADETAAIAWPIPLDRATISEADLAHPRLADAKPVPARRTVIVGCGGQLGRALTALLPDAIGVDLPDFDLTDPGVVDAVDWTNVGAIINASAYTAVDAAETPEGRRAAWAANVDGVARLCRIAAEHRITLVHVSSDYVFDGAAEEHDEAEPFAPLSVYGQTKAAGDVLVGQLARHYIVRTSWVIGAGRNFVRTMAELAAKGVAPTVVDDQYGRLTFTEDLAAGIVHLLGSGARYGTYNLTNTGPVQSWAEIAGDVFELCGRSRSDVTPITTAQYAEGKVLAPRPVHSALKLDKLIAAGFVPKTVAERLACYVAGRDAD
jgi:dTDP-4-dehydrorhamnose 3,5-epimerase